MAADYPEKLPPPVRDGFTARHHSPFNSVEMDDGYPRVRRQFSAQPARFDLQWTFTWEQLALFEAFIEYGAAQAAGWFKVPIFGDQDPTDVRLTEGYETTFNAQANTWQVSAKVETLFAAPVLPPRGLPSWPATLPEPEQENYGFSVPGVPLRSQQEDGLAEQRIRFQDRVLQYRVTWLLDKEQKIIFDAFYRDTLIHGAAWFMAPFANGLGPTQVRARFTGAVTVASFGAAYKLSATLLTAAAPRMSLPEYLGEVVAPGQYELSDALLLGATGAVEYQDYADDYFGQDYVGTRETFS